MYYHFPRCLLNIIFMSINIFYVINPSYSLTIPHPLERILLILKLKEEIFKEEKCYVSDVTIFIYVCDFATSYVHKMREYTLGCSKRNRIFFSFSLVPNTSEFNWNHTRFDQARVSSSLFAPFNETFHEINVKMSLHLLSKCAL